MMTYGQIALSAAGMLGRGMALAPALRRMISDFAGAVLILLLMPFLLITGGFAAGPETSHKPTINGKWEFNLRNSNMGNMPAPQHATLVVSAQGNKLMWRETGLDADGRPFDYIFDGSIDGGVYPLKGTHSPVTIAFKREKGTLVSTWKGKGRRLSIARVSADGKSLTIESVSCVYNMVGNWITAWDRVPNN